jgi:hypothetical protein
MYDETHHDTADPSHSYDEISQTDATGISSTFTRDHSDQSGFIANFVRDQPVLTLSLAFGLGLLAASLLARKPA